MPTSNPGAPTHRESSALAASHIALTAAKWARWKSAPILDSAARRTRACAAAASPLLRSPAPHSELVSVASRARAPRTAHVMPCNRCNELLSTPLSLCSAQRCPHACRDDPARRAAGLGLRARWHQRTHLRVDRVELHHRVPKGHQPGRHAARQLVVAAQRGAQPRVADDCAEGCQECSSSQWRAGAFPDVGTAPARGGTAPRQVSQHHTHLGRWESRLPARRRARGRAESLQTL